MKSLLLTATILAVSAQAASVTFSTLPGGNGATFNNVTEQGITVTSTSGLWQQGFNVGNPIPSIFTFDEVASVTVTSGGTFRFVSFDLGTGGILGPSYNIVGLLSGSTIFSATGTNADASFHTIASPSSSLVDTLIITALRNPSSSANLDNIVVSTVPEPASLSLFAGGLGTLFLMHRRRRA